MVTQLPTNLFLFQRKDIMIHFDIYIIQEMSFLSAIMKVLFFFGTRREAIKMAPDPRIPERSKRGRNKNLCDAQHRRCWIRCCTFLRSARFYLDIHEPIRAFHVTGEALRGLHGVFKNYSRMVCLSRLHPRRPSWSSGAFMKGPRGHIEAWVAIALTNIPVSEEMNRLLTARLADIHFSPPRGEENLLKEGNPGERISVVGIRHRRLFFAGQDF